MGNIIATCYKLFLYPVKFHFHRSALLSLMLGEAMESVAEAECSLTVLLSHKMDLKCL